ncbi:hypothetical protein [Leisingera aquaemixtae]|uniref:hypothetical protein n=1 Tax=Leisingera aquaemixtae TaxID=1396826 RepID=UPI001FCA9A2C|nr:hypothetical protein [Leisingera aquaemixtae]
MSDEQPVQHLQLQARILDVIANAQQKTGDVEQSLKNSSEALAIRLFFAEQRPNASRYELALSYNNVGTKLAADENFELAYEHTKNAKLILEQLMKELDGAVASDYAMVLRNLSVRSSQIGKEEESKAMADEAQKVSG